jgi:hypothetical protein
MNREYRSHGNTSFFDILFHAIFGITALFILAVCLIKVANKTEDKKVDIMGEYLISMRWPSESADDVDLYVRDPNEETVYYKAHERGLMNLDKDDRGKKTDTTQNQYGEERSVEQNEETVNIRGVLEGEYVINVHMWAKDSSEQTPVTISLTRIRGKDKVEKTVEVILTERGDEKTAFRFTLDEKGNCKGFSDLPMTMFDGPADIEVP